MRKTSKLMLLLLMLSVFVLVFASCKKSGNTTNEKPPSTIDEQVIYSTYVDATIILGEGIESSDIADIRNAYYKVVGKEIAIKTADQEPSSHEIVIGKTDRDISNKAYRGLKLRNSEEDFVGFSIYSDGNSVAIAFDTASFGENVAFSEAIDHFVSSYMKKNSLKLNSGLIYFECFDPIEKQKERDSVLLDKHWDLKYSQILSRVQDNKELANAILEELQGLNDMYNIDHKTPTWLANLYDPVTGGFYYSNSARNNENFASDLGSTADALYLSELILAGYGGTLTDYFGEEIADKFVSFAKSMQQPNGYFYHPQWLLELIEKTPERKEADVLNALNILEAFGASPTYDIGDVKGDGVAAVSSLTLPLHKSDVSAVSALVEAEENVIYIPSYLKSEEAFISYLDALDIRSDTSGALKVLNSEIAQYVAVDEIMKDEGAGYSLCSILGNFLAKNQDPITGLWCYSGTELSDALENLSYIIRIYNAMGSVVPNLGYITDTLITEMSSDSKPEAINDISVLWTALDLLINNIKNYGHQYSELAADYSVQAIYRSLPTTLSVTAQMLSKFAKEDGSFASELDETDPLKPKSYSASNVYGMSVALPLTEEGDMNATLIATKNIWLSIFNVIGVGAVPLFNASDRMLYQKTLLDMGVIIKNEIIKTPAEDFEEMELGSTANIEIEQLQGGEAFTRVEEGPEELGNVLHLYSSNTSIKDCGFHFGIQSTVRSASCYSYELDMCVLPETDQGFIADVHLYYHLHCLSIERVGDQLKFVEFSNPWSDATSFVTDLNTTANVGEWFKLRVEFYYGTSEAFRIKIYLQREGEEELKCIAVTNNHYGRVVGEPTPTVSRYEGVSVFAIGKKEVNILVDNVISETTYKTYVAEESPDFLVNLETSDKKQEVNNFDNLAAGSTPSELKPSGEASAVVVKTDSNGNNVLAISEKAGEVIIPVDQRGYNTNSAILKFDLIVDSESEVGTVYQINFNELGYLERNFGAMQLMVLEENGIKYVTFADVVSNKASTVHTQIKLSLGEKYHISLQLFYLEKALILTIDNEIYAINGSILDKSEQYYMRQTTIEALTPALKSTILVDNLVSERIVSNYEEVTSPTVPRDEYTFDDTEGMETSGNITADGGVLSFNGVTSGDTYIKIPVNDRVNVPTLAVVAFDVTKTESINGELIISMLDKKGNTVAELSLVRNKDKVEIHERTSNGTYPTPLYTVTSSSFKLGIKYSAQVKGYNVFVDDTYMISSSILYTRTSGEYEFEYLKIGCNAPVGLAIDNLYAENVCSGVILTEGAVANDDHTSEKLTYEQSSFTSLSEKLVKLFNASGAALNIREEKIKDAANKVLEFYSGGSGNILNVYKTQTVADTNAAFFETEMMLKSHGGKISFLFSPQAITNQTYPYLCDFVLTAAKPGAPITLTTKDDINETLGVTEGQWFKIRFEYAATPYDYDYNGINDAFIRVYVNDSLVAEGHKTRDENIVPEANTIYRTKIASSTEGTLFLNDTAQGQFNMKYDEPIPLDEGTLEFNPDIITFQTPFTFEKVTSTAQISKLPTAEDAANKVLEFYTSKDSQDKMSVIVTQENADANAVMFETDIMIEPVTDTAVFYLEPVNAKGKQPFRLTLTANKGGDVTLTDPQNSREQIVIGKCGEWIHLKVEYMNPMLDYTADKKADILYKVYVGTDSEPVAKGYNTYAAGAYYDPLTLTKYVFTTQSADEATVFFDNIRFWQVTLTPDTPDEFEDEDDFIHGGSGTDLGAWT